MRPSRLVNEPSFSSAAVAGTITWAQPVTSFGNIVTATTASAFCTAARQRAAFGQADTGSASPSRISSFSSPASARLSSSPASVVKPTRRAPRSLGDCGSGRIPPGFWCRPPSWASTHEPVEVDRVGDQDDRRLGGPQRLEQALEDRAGLDAGRDQAVGRVAVEVGAAGAGQHELRAAADGLSHPQVEHPCGVVQLAVARDHDQVGLLEIGDPGGVGVEPFPGAGGGVGRGHERAAARRLDGQRPGVQLLVGLLARGDDGHGVRAVQVHVVAQAPGDALDDLAVARVVEAAVAAQQRAGEAVGRLQVLVGEAALVAQPALVELGVVARQHPLDAALAHRGPGVAAGRAQAADRRDVVDLPRPGLEAVLGRGQRADRAELDDVPRERADVRLLLEGGDDRAGAALAGDQLLVLGHVAREAGAAVAEDAALAVERDQRRHRDGLLVGPLRQVEAGVAGPVAVGRGPAAGTRRPCRRPGSRAGGSGG